jgi:hypothetical protein
MKANHTRTLQSEKQVCSRDGVAGGPARPTGPGLSDALGTTRGGSLDPLAPNSGTLDTLTGNVLESRATSAPQSAGSARCRTARPPRSRSPACAPD